MDHLGRLNMYIVTIFCVFIQGVQALDDAVIGIIAASVVLILFAIIAVIFTAYYCNSMLKKKAESVTSGPPEYNTVSTVAAGYTSYSYPPHWFYTDSRYYPHSKRLASYRPRVLSDNEDGPPEERSRSSHDKRKVRSANGYLRNHYAASKKSERLSNWLDSNYDENVVSMHIGQEDDDGRESLTAEQFLAQQIENRKLLDQQQHQQIHKPDQDDGEFTIVDYVDDGSLDKRSRKTSSPTKYERQPDPLPPSSMPMYKSTIGVVQEKNENRLQQNGDAVRDGVLYVSSTSSPARSSNHSNPPLINDVFQAPDDVDVTSQDGSHHRQRVAHAGSVPELPPDDPVTYNEFLTGQLKNY